MIKNFKSLFRGREERERERESKKSINDNEKKLVNEWVNEAEYKELVIYAFKKYKQIIPLLLNRNIIKSSSPYLVQQNS